MAGGSHPWSSLWPPNLPVSGSHPGAPQHEQLKWTRMRQKQPKTSKKHPKHSKTRYLHESDSTSQSNSVSIKCFPLCHIAMARPKTTKTLEHLDVPDWPDSVNKMARSSRYRHWCILLQYAFGSLQLLLPGNYMELYGITIKLQRKSRLTGISAALPVAQFLSIKCSQVHTEMAMDPSWLGRCHAAVCVRLLLANFKALMSSGSVNWSTTATGNCSKTKWKKVILGRWKLMENWRPSWRCLFMMVLLFEHGQIQMLQF